MGDAPFNQPGEITSVKIHPVVLFSILDHYMRRNEGQRRVIGTLLGSVAGNSIEIQNCFPVPHVEKGDEVAVGKDFNRQMYYLHQKVNASEEIMGWYATALDFREGVESPTDFLINTQSCLIHDYYNSECEQPLHLVVDTNLSNNQLGIKAFISSPLAAGERSLAAAFRQIKVELACEEPERIGVGKMLKSEPVLGGVTNVESELDGLEQSMQHLLGLLESSHAYVERVIEGKEEANYQIGTKLAQVISNVPRIQPEVFAKSFQNNLKDLLMLVYLSNMTRTQLAVAERLSNTVS